MKKRELLVKVLSCIIWLSLCTVNGQTDIFEPFENDPILYGWLTGNKHYFLSSQVKETLFGHNKSDWTAARELAVDHFIKDLHILLDRESEHEERKSGMLNPSKLKLRTVCYDDEEAHCGLTVKNLAEEEKGWEEAGCGFLEDSPNHFFCNDPELSYVPKLPDNLQIVDFNSTKISFIGKQIRKSQVTS